MPEIIEGRPAAPMIGGFRYGFAETSESFGKAVTVLSLPRTAKTGFSYLFISCISLSQCATSAGDARQVNLANGIQGDFPAVWRAGNKGMNRRECAGRQGGAPG